EFGCWCYVPFATRRPTHYNAAANCINDFGLASHSKCNICQWAESQDFDPRIGKSTLNDRIYGVERIRAPGLGSVAVIAQTIVSMNPLRRYKLAQKRLCCPGKYGRVRSTKLDSVQNVLCGLFDGHIASNDCNCRDVNVRGPQRHNERHYVVRAT